MAEYDFSTLNSSDLEELVCDLLNASVTTAIRYRTFKTGKDMGIDILYSTDSNEYEHVVQVKHYYRSGFDALLQALRKEAEKVKRLKPTRYIVATSVDLSPKNSQDIKLLFDPYVRNLNDILGKRDLNAMLDTYPEVLQNHFKLWFSSTSVLAKLLNADIELRAADFIQQDLAQKLRLLVKTDAFDIARKKLESNRFIIISGEPGVGKTTLAEILISEYLIDDYKFTFIVDDIKEVERILIPDDSKQVIFFDDFLGSTEIEINRAKGSESALRSIVKRIQRRKNKLFICTTRSHLLNTALEESEKLGELNLKQKEFVLNLEPYNDDVKLRLLANHIEESTLPEQYKEILRELRYFIIRHQNFTPRSVEYITSDENFVGFDDVEFHNFVLENFDYPEKIWRHAYAKQIKSNDRLLLNTLLTFGKPVPRRELQRAFSFRLEIESNKSNSELEVNAFVNSLNRIEGSFIAINKKTRAINFINPSLIDFLNQYLANDQSELKKMMTSICTTGQLVNSFLNKDPKNEMPSTLMTRLLRNPQEFASEDHRDSDLIKIVLVLYKHADLKNSESLIIQILNRIRDWEILHRDYSLNMDFRAFMSTAKSYSKVNDIFNEKVFEILMNLILGEYRADVAVDLIEGFSTDYEINITHFQTARIVVHLEHLINDYTEHAIEKLMENISDESEAFELRGEIADLIDRCEKMGLRIDCSTEMFEHIPWSEYVLENGTREANAYQDDDDN